MKRFAVVSTALVIGVIAACSGGNNNASDASTTGDAAAPLPTTTTTYDAAAATAVTTTGSCPPSTTQTTAVDAGISFTACTLADGAVLSLATAQSTVCPYLPSEPTLSSTFIASSGECQLQDGSVVPPATAQATAGGTTTTGVVTTTPGTTCTINQTAGQNGTTPLTISTSGTICGSTSASDPNGDLYEAFVGATQSQITVSVAPTGDAIFLIYDNQGLVQMLGNAETLSAAVVLGGNVFSAFTSELPAGDPIPSDLTWSSTSRGTRYNGALGIQVVSPSHAVGQTYTITVTMQ